MIVAGRLRKNTKITATTRITASTSSVSTSCTDARIVSVRSVRIATLTAEGSDCWSVGRSARMLSTTSMTFAPGWRWMLRMTAGTRLDQAASSVFSGALATSATSLRRTGAPFL